MTGSTWSDAIALALAAAAVLAAAPAAGQGLQPAPGERAGAVEPVAVVTEIRSGPGGEALFKRAGASSEPRAGEAVAEWTPVQPLLALRPGDQLRVTGDGRVVLVYAGGLGTRTVSAAGSPFTVEAPRAQGGVSGVLAGVTGFLFGKADTPAYVSAFVPLSTRGVPPVLLAPRDAKVLPGAIHFEWAGSERLRYRVRLVGPGGPVWEQGDLRRGPVAYPASAPALQAGVRYAWELHADPHPPQRGEFEVLTAEEAARVRAALARLDPAALPGYAPVSVVLMRAALLMQEQLHGEARRELLAALAASPEEPSLHHLLGHVYDRSGLRDLAVESFEEARVLAAPRR